MVSAEETVISAEEAVISAEETVISTEETVISAEETVIRVLISLAQHTKPSYTTSMTQRQETLIGTKPGHRIHPMLKKLKVTLNS